MSSNESTQEHLADTPDQPGAPSTAPAQPFTGPIQPQQGEMPFAVVMGKAVTELPKDLYIPPQALEVFLEAFEGPLDLLLYLIRRQNLDILEIDVSRITEQYMQYVELMDAMQFELAAEYLLMAAVLAEIKSRMLLPRSSEVEDDEEDPRAQLIRRLQEYERFKKAAEDIEELPRMERDTWTGSANPPELNRERPDPDVDMRELLVAARWYGLPLHFLDTRVAYPRDGRSHFRYGRDNLRMVLLHLRLLPLALWHTPRLIADRLTNRAGAVTGD